MLDWARSLLKYREAARTAAPDSADWLNSINDAIGALMLLGRASAASTRTQAGFAMMRDRFPGLPGGRQEGDAPPEDNHDRFFSLRR